MVVFVTVGLGATWTALVLQGWQVAKRAKEAERRRRVAEDAESVLRANLLMQEEAILRVLQEYRDAASRAAGAVVIAESQRALMLAEATGQLRGIYEHAEAMGSRLIEAAAVLRRVAELGDPTGVLVRSAAGRNLMLPAHWIKGQAAVPIPEGSACFNALSQSLVTNPRWLGTGRDMRHPGRYSKLTLVRAWRVEDDTLWRQYAVARESVATALDRGTLPRGGVEVRPETSAALGPRGTALPDPLQHDGGINEVRLFHGPSLDAIQHILYSGFNERLCSNDAFGHGMYFAEDAGKADQYCEQHNLRPEMPRLAGLWHLLYPAGPDTMLNGVFYMFVCRAVCGYPVRTRDGHHSLDMSQVFADGRRDLQLVSNGSERYTSLIVELQGAVKRYREFVFFRGHLVYPEYLLAYRRE